MPNYTTADIRNIALTGQNACGKTTLIEALLFRLKLIGRMGTVDDGNTVCDFEQEEKEHKHSLNAAIVNFDHDGHHFNIIDTPGAPDFIGQAIGAFPAVETVAVVIAADRGIQTVTRRIMALAQERKLPRMIIINKIDEHAGSLESLVDQIRETFGSVCLPLNIPTPDCSSVVNVLEKADGDVLFSSVEEAHTAIIDQVVEVDEKLMAEYLDKGTVSPDQLHDAFEKALRESHLVPIVFCSARSGTGLDDLLHVMSHLCPSPLEGNPRPFQLRAEEGAAEQEWHAEPDPSKPVVAHVFKVTTDQFIGKLSLVRIHQGTIKPGDQLHIGDQKKPIRIAHLQKIHGKDHKEADSAIPGDIIGVAKIEELTLNCVLHTGTGLSDLRFKAPPMPRPMYGLALESKNRGDESKISTALQKLQEEDPTFKVERVAATHQTVARGLGELHMRVILEKLQHRFKLDIETKPPKVAYKETVLGKAEGHHRHKKQTGGAGQFGEVFLRIEPLNHSAENAHDHHDQWAGRLEFVDETVGGSIPRQFLPAIEKGIKQAMEQGAVAGYPMTGVCVRVYDGKYHPVDSKEVAFVTAGKRAFIDAVKKAKPALLEPICDLEITAPASKLGDITADLSGKRGQVLGTDVLPGDMCLIRAKAPLAEMNTYANQLKSMTGGQGSFVMDYSHDEHTPPNVQAEIVASYNPQEEED